MNHRRKYDDGAAMQCCEHRMERIDDAVPKRPTLALRALIANSKHIAAAVRALPEAFGCEVVDVMNHRRRCGATGPDSIAYVRRLRLMTPWLPPEPS